MDVLMLTTPIVVMVGLLALMQRIEGRMTEHAPVRITTEDAPRPMTRADVVAPRSETSRFVAGAPFAVLVTTAVLLGAALVRMAS